MDTIEQLFFILNTHTPQNSVVRITLSPWAWLMVTSGDIEHNFVADGSATDRPEPQMAGESITIGIDPAQVTAFRLWDREGQEVPPDSNGETEEANA